MADTTKVKHRRHLLLDSGHYGVVFLSHDAAVVRHKSNQVSPRNAILKENLLEMIKDVGCSSNVRNWHGQEFGVGTIREVAEQDGKGFVAIPVVAFINGHGK